MTETCPKCSNDDLHRDEADVGVGIIYGPWGCPACGWSEYSEYDLSDGRSAVDERGGAIDQYGGYHPPGSSMAEAYRLAEEVETWPCPICGGRDDERQLQCEACGGVGLLGGPTS